MLAMAAARLGFDVVILTPEPGSAAARVAAREILGPYEDEAALAALAQAADVVTFEFENVPAAAVERLIALGVAVAPGAEALSIAHDRREEKGVINPPRAPTAGVAQISEEADVAAAVKRLGAP